MCPAQGSLEADGFARLFLSSEDPAGWTQGPRKKQT